MIDLRPYQKELVQKIYQGWEGSQRVCLQCPTGGGKTIIMSQIVRDALDTNPGAHILVVAHRRELIMQTHLKLGQFGVSSFPLMGGVVRNLDYPIQIASIQTWRAIKRKPKADLVIIDESHHFRDDNTYGQLIEEYPNAFFLGVTATPCRQDGKGFDDVFQSLILGPSVRELTGWGYLCRYTPFTCPSPDLSGMRLVGGDYNERQLEERVSTVLGHITDSWVAIAQDKRTMVFAATVKHSLSIVERYRAIGVAAEHVDGETPLLERRETLNRFRSGQTTVLSNVNVFSEGTDIPCIEAIQLCRPTKSLILYLQQVGRGLRPSPATGKDKLLVLDHGQCILEHGLPDEFIDWQEKFRGAVVPKAKDEPFASDKEVSDQLEIEEVDSTIQEAPELGILKELDVSYQAVIDRFIARQELLGHKKYSVFYKVKEHFDRDIRVEHLRYLASKFGYKPGWAKHKYAEIQEELEGAYQTA